MADARTVIRAIVALEPGINESKITHEQGDYIASLFEGDFSLFRQLDELPGRYTSPWFHGCDGDHSYNSWHWKLRQARNDGHNHFFDILFNPTLYKSTDN